jgi:hypothetical protein
MKAQYHIQEVKILRQCVTIRNISNTTVTNSLNLGHTAYINIHMEDKLFMKKLSGLLIALLATTNVIADEQQKDALATLTLAAAEPSSFNWVKPVSAKKAEVRAESLLEQKALDMSEEINAKLEKALEEKLSRSLNF